MNKPRPGVGSVKKRILVSGQVGEVASEVVGEVWKLKIGRFILTS